MRDLLSQELKKATNDVMKIEIQRRLEGAEREFRERKEKVNAKEREVNQYEGELKKEDEFTVFQSLTVNTYSSID